MMKKTLIFALVFFTMSYADVVLRGMHKYEIKSVDFCKNYLLTAGEKKIKVWDLKNQEMKDFISSNYISFAKFDNHCNIYYLQSGNLNKYNLTTKKNTFIKHFYSTKDMVVTKDYVYILTYSGLNKLNVITNKIKYFSIYTNPNSFTYSKFGKNFAINYTNSVYIYDKFGNLITKLSATLNLYKSVFINDKLVLLFSKNEEKSIFEVYNFKTGEKIISKSFRNENNIQSISLLNRNNIIAVNKNQEIIQILLPTLQVKKLFKINFFPNSIEVSRDKKYLVATKENNFVVYTLENVNVKKNQIIQKTKIQNITPTTKELKKDIVQKTIPLTKQKETKENNENKNNINMLVNVSKTEGYAPLSTIVSINIDNPQNVVAYYLDLAGKVKVSKGVPPKKIKLTLRKAGKYNILIAVKDINNKVYKKRITIVVKEKTFKDFLKEMN